MEGRDELSSMFGRRAIWSKANRIDLPPRLVAPNDGSTLAFSHVAATRRMWCTAAEWDPASGASNVF